MTTPPASPQSFGSGSLSINSKEAEEKEQGAAGYLDAEEMPTGPSGECLGVEEQASAFSFPVTPASCQLQLGGEKADSSEELGAAAETLETQSGSFLDSPVGNQFPTLIRSFQVVTALTMTLWERAGSASGLWRRRGGSGGKGCGLCCSQRHS
jgi:hypothetical protein